LENAWEGVQCKNCSSSSFLWPLFRSSRIVHDKHEKVKYQGVTQSTQLFYYKKSLFLHKTLQFSTFKGH
jgi:hypothetical protein